MKSKILRNVIILMAVTAMTGCGNKEAETVEETTEVSTEAESEEVSEESSIAETSTVEQTTAVETTTMPVTVVTTQAVKAQPKTETPPTKTVTAPAAGSLGVTYKNVKITLNTSISTVSASLGSTTDYSEAPSCNYNGLDKVFTYGSVSIYTYPHESGDLINEIEVNDSSVATDKGITPIGKSMEEIKTTYGEPTSVDGSTYKYANGNCYTYFYADGDTVTYWGVVYEA